MLLVNLVRDLRSNNQVLLVGVDSLKQTSFTKFIKLISTFILWHLRQIRGIYHEYFISSGVLLDQLDLLRNYEYCLAGDSVQYTVIFNLNLIYFDWINQSLKICFW